MIIVSGRGIKRYCASFKQIFLTAGIDIACPEAQSGRYCKGGLALVRRVKVQFVVDRLFPRVDDLQGDMYRLFHRHL